MSRRGATGATGNAPQVKAAHKACERLDSEDESHAQSIAQAIVGAVNDVQAALATSGMDSADEWIGGLSCTSAGRKLLDHLSHCEAAPHIKASSAFEQASAFRRVLVHALKKKVNPFGLPKTLPKYMAMVNFSGDRQFMYSDNPHLIAFIAMGGDGGHPSADGVQKILDHTNKTPGCSALLCYSLPFQSGYENAYWECRVITRSQAGVVSDNQLVCSSWEKTASRGMDTAVVEEIDPSAIDKQELAYSENMTACDVDVEIFPLPDVEEVDGDDQLGKLMRMVTMLQSERKKMQTEHKQEIDEMHALHNLDCAKTLEAVENGFKKQTHVEAEMKQRTEQAETEVRMIRDVLKKREQDIQQMRSDALLKDEETKSVINNLHEKLIGSEREKGLLAKELKKSSASQSTALGRKDAAHARIIDDMERKLQESDMKAKKVLQDIERDMERARKVERAFDSVSAEKELVESELKALKLQGLSMRMRLAVSRARGDKLDEMVKKARMSHAEAEESILRLSKEISASTASSATIQEAAGAAAHESEELQKERDDMAARLHGLRIERDELLSAAESAREKPKMADAETMTVPVLSKAEIDLGELSTVHAKLQDELIANKTEIADLKAEAARKRKARNPPPSFLSDTGDGVPTALGVVAQQQQQQQQTDTTRAPNVVNNTVIVPGNGHMDMAHDPNGDPLIEGTIAQIQMAMRTLSDRARQSMYHERAARDAFAKVEVLERLYGTAPQFGHMQFHGQGAMMYQGNIYQ